MLKSDGFANLDKITGISGSAAEKIYKIRYASES